MNKKIFLDGMTKIMLNFPAKQFDANICWTFLQDLTDEQFIKAITMILTNKEEINQATNLIAIIRAYAMPVETMEAGEAWGLVLKEIGWTGYCKQPRFKNKLVAHAVDCIGWRNLCISEEPSIDRAHFIKIFTALRDRHNAGLTMIPQMKELTMTILKEIEAKHEK